MSWKKVVIGLILLICIAVVVVANMGPKEKVKILVEVEPARMEPITQVVTASGKILAERSVKVTADVGGYIRKLTVKEGDQVEAGQLLVEIDPEIYRARVMESKAVEQTARANLSLAQADLSRSKSEEKRVLGLYRKDLTSKSELERAQADRAITEARVEAARGQLMQAKASLDKALKDLAKCTITSPLSGTVISLYKEQGERASGGDFREDIIMTIANLDSMEVEVEVGERDVVLVHIGDQVDIEVDALPDKRIYGHVKEVANSGTTKNLGTEAEVTDFRVVVQVDSAPSELKPQMSATVKIQTDHRDSTLTVPIQSVTLRKQSELRIHKGAEEKDDAGNVNSKSRLGSLPGNKKSLVPRRSGTNRPLEVVFVVIDGVASAVRVKTGLSSDTRMEIIQGLKEGQMVVSGPYRALSKDLQDGDEVRMELEEPGNIHGRRRKKAHR